MKHFAWFRVGFGVPFALLFSSCVAWKPLPFGDAPALPPLPAAYEGYYDYPLPETVEAALIEEREERGYYFKLVEFPLNLPPELQVPNLPEYKKEMEELGKTDQKTTRDLKLRYLNRVELYIPKDIKPHEKRPVILISPILGGNMVVDRFARYYAGRGYVAALVHRKRLKWDDEQGIEQMENYMRSSVIRLRQALDWVERQPQADPGRIGAFGVSYGAILHSILAAVEPRIKHHVLAMPGAPIPDVFIDCPDSACVKARKHVFEKYGWTEEVFYQKMKETMRTDPIFLAASVPKERVTVYIALFDRVVGAGRSFKLWKAMGRPELKVMPFGHYGGVLVFPLLQTQSYLSFKRHLK